MFAPADCRQFALEKKLKIEYKFIIIYLYQSILPFPCNFDEFYEKIRENAKTKKNVYCRFTLSSLILMICRKY